MRRFAWNDDRNDEPVVEGDRHADVDLAVPQMRVSSHARRVGCAVAGKIVNSIWVKELSWEQHFLHPFIYHKRRDECPGEQQSEQMMRA